MLYVWRFQSGLQGNNRASQVGSSVRILISQPLNGRLTVWHVVKNMCLSGVSIEHVYSLHRSNTLLLSQPCTLYPHLECCFLLHRGFNETHEECRNLKQALKVVHRTKPAAEGENSCSDMFLVPAGVGLVSQLVNCLCSICYSYQNSQGCCAQHFVVLKQLWTCSPFKNQKIVANLWSWWNVNLPVSAQHRKYFILIQCCCAEISNWPVNNTWWHCTTCRVIFVMTIQSSLGMRIAFSDDKNSRKRHKKAACEGYVSKSLQLRGCQRTCTTHMRYLIFWFKVVPKLLLLQWHGFSVTIEPRPLCFRFHPGASRAESTMLSSGIVSLYQDCFILILVLDVREYHHDTNFHMSLFLQLQPPLCTTLTIKW